MTTIRQLLDAWEVQLFSPNSDDDFVKSCAAREKGLKNFLYVCWKEIELHCQAPSLTTAELIGWRKNKIDKNLKNLNLYLDELVGELQKEKIEQYVALKRTLTKRWLPFEPDPLLFTFHSYYGTVLTDIFWIEDLTVADVIFISKRELDLSELGRYVVGQLDKIKSLLAGHKTIFTIHNIPIQGLNEAFDCHQNGFYKGFNLIMVTIIEGIVRSFGEYLKKEQNVAGAGIKKSVSHSLDGFMRNTLWAIDLDLPKTKYFGITGDYNLSDRRSFSLNDRPIRETVKVSYKTRLDFLGRGFKEQRNLLAHGKEVEYESTLQALINAAALAEVLETIVEYKEIYPN